MNQLEIIKGPLSELEKNKIVFLYGKGLTFSQIARDKKVCLIGLTSRQKGSGRKQEFDSTFRQQALDYFAVNSMKTYKDAINEQNWTCSKSWICKFLKEHNIRAFVASKKPFLSEQHLLQRAKFATDNSNWTEKDWKNGIFSDEKTIQSHARGPIKVKRVRGAPFDQSQVVIVLKNKFAITIWGCTLGCDLSFHVFQVDKHFNAALYRYHLRRVAFPLFEEKYENLELFFQQDNASIHTPRIIKAFFALLICRQSKTYGQFFRIASTSDFEMRLQQMHSSCSKLRKKKQSWSKNWRLKNCMLACLNAFRCWKKINANPSSIKMRNLRVKSQM